MWQPRRRSRRSRALRSSTRQTSTLPVTSPSSRKAADGPLPLRLRAWYEQVGRVSLMGSHPVLNPKDDRRDPLAPPPEMVSMIDAIGLDHVAVWGEMEALGAEIAGTCEDAQKVIRETMVPQTDERHLRHRELTIRSTGVPSKCQFP